MALILSTPASTFPVSVEAAKEQCSATGTSDFDFILQGYISAACDAAELYLGKALTQQEWKLVLDDWSNVIELPLGPITNSTVVSYLDENGDEQILAPSAYEIDAYGSPPRLQPVNGQAWPKLKGGLNSVSITFTTEPAATPNSVKQAILMMVAFWFSNREAIGSAMTEIPMAWRHLLDPHARVQI
jgi:uncharacterized phiE125 gp8 family phage protein